MNHVKRWLSTLFVIVTIVTANTWESAHGYVRGFFWVRGRVLVKSVRWALMGAGGINVITSLYSYMRLDMYRGMLLFIAGGMILADDSDVVEFQPASEEDARQAGLSVDEMASYNQDLPRINLAMDAMVASVLEKTRNGRAEPSGIQLHQLWLTISDEYEIPDTTRSAVRKVIATSLQVSSLGQ